MAEIPKFLERAEKALQKGKPESALNEYLAILELDPTHDLAKESAAGLYASLNQKARAAGLFTELLYHYVGTSNLRKTNMIYKRLSRLRPAPPEEALLIAELNEKKNPREAVMAYQTALDSYRKLCRHAEEYRVLVRLTQLDPSADRLRQLGEAALRLDRKQEAASAYARVGLDLLRQGREGQSQAANEAFAKAYELDAENTTAALGHAQALMSDGPAERALLILERLVAPPLSLPEAREPYGLALLGAGRRREAEPFLWEMFARDPQSSLERILDLIGRTLDAGEDEHAVELSRRLEQAQGRLGLRREYIGQMKQIMGARQPGTTFLEYLATVYDAANHETDMTATLAQLFDRYADAGDYERAAHALERAVEVDAYEAGHRSRLEKLQGKIERARLSAMSQRLGRTKNAPEVSERRAEAVSSSVTLEELLLEAELFSQYALKRQALAAVAKLRELFPLEEETNERLRQICTSLGLEVREPRAATEEALTETADTLVSRVSEVNRAIARQKSLKAVLSTAARGIGTHWQLSRCIAGVGTESGAPPLVVEFAMPGEKPTPPAALGELLGAAVEAVSGKSVFVLEDSAEAGQLPAGGGVLGMHNAASFAAIPLNNAGGTAGALILESSVARKWTDSDLVLLRTVADQMVLAVDAARLRNLVQNLDVTDEASGLLKRSSYLDLLLAEVVRAKSKGTPLTLVLLDCGSPARIPHDGDEHAVQKRMQNVGAAVQSHMRQGDAAFRYGALEIALLLSGTPEKGAFTVLERLKRSLKEAWAGELPAPAISGGIAEANMDPAFDADDIVTEVINRLEAAVLRARTRIPGAVCSLAPSAEPAWLD